MLWRKMETQQAINDASREELFGLRQFPMLAAAMPTMQKAIATVEAHPSQ